MYNSKLTLPPIRTHPRRPAGCGVMYRAIFKGRLSGIFEDIEYSKRYVEGYPDAIHRIFECKEEASQWMEEQKEREVKEENARLHEIYGEGCTDWDGNGIEADRIGIDVKSQDQIYAQDEDVPELPKEVLAEEQKHILNLVLKGHNVFFTGPAGSGKSLLLRYIKYHLWRRKVKYAVTAPTGVAAVLIGGRTIHSWSGLGKGDKGLDRYINHAWKQIRDILEADKEAGNSWRETDVLIIDEISMLSPDLFEKLDKIARAWRAPNPTDFPRNITRDGLDETLNKILPFGGMQLVVCGDFFQLPPVDVENSKTCYKCGEPVIPSDERRYLPEDHGRIKKEISGLDYIHVMNVNPARWTVCTRRDGNIECGHLWNDTVKYCFQTKTWSQINFRSAFLTKVHRQTDQAWIDMLSKIKTGDVTEDILNRLVSLGRPLKPNESGIKPTKLYCFRNDVDRENREEFDKLTSKIYNFPTFDRGELCCPDRRFGRTLEEYELRGQPFFHNLPVSSYLTLRHGAQVMLLSNIDVKAKLVNGSRGVVTGFCRITRDKLLGGIKDGFVKKALFDYFTANTTHATETVPIPVVRFTGHDKPQRILPVCWDEHISQWISPTKKNILHLIRVQIPLGLAWAMTIHKSQGSTLDFVSVQVCGAFDPGQAYVGLSRCKSPDGMQIHGHRIGIRNACMPNESASIFNAYMMLKAKRERKHKELMGSQGSNGEASTRADHD